jgi:hypothetical protein
MARFFVEGNGFERLLLRKTTSKGNLAKDRTAMENKGEDLCFNIKAETVEVVLIVPETVTIPNNGPPSIALYLLTAGPLNHDTMTGFNALPQIMSDKSPNIILRSIRTIDRTSSIHFAVQKIDSILSNFIFVGSAMVVCNYMERKKCPATLLPALLSSVVQLNLDDKEGNNNHHLYKMSNISNNA